MKSAVLLPRWVQGMTQAEAVAGADVVVVVGTSTEVTGPSDWLVSPAVAVLGSLVD